MTMDEKKKMLAFGLFKAYSTRVDPGEICIDTTTRLAFYVSTCSDHFYFYIPFAGWFTQVSDIKHKGSLTKKIPNQYKQLKKYMATIFSEKFDYYFLDNDIKIIDIGSKHFLLAYSMKDQRFYFSFLSFSYARKTLILNETIQF